LNPIKQIPVCEECGEICRNICSVCGNLFCNDCMPDGYITVVDDDTGKEILYCEDCHPDNGIRCPTCGQMFPEARFQLKSDTPARNAPCPCGSGKKYKKCCGKAKNESQGTH
jgi:hypothetical protein